MATAISTTTVGSPGIPLSHERADGGLAARQRAFLWLLAFALLGVALKLIFPDSSSEDGGAHFLEAHWAWSAGHHHLLVDVWGRPLFTVLYSLAARLGYPAAKLVSVSLALGTAWQSWRAAEDYQFAHPELAIPLLLLQPTFLSVAPETMTEPLFTLVLIVALRAHLHGRMALGAFLASLLPLARPEGPFIVALWGVWEFWAGFTAARSRGAFGRRSPEGEEPRQPRVGGRALLRLSRWKTSARRSRRAISHRRSPAEAATPRFRSMTRPRSSQWRPR